MANTIKTSNPSFEELASIGSRSRRNAVKVSASDATNVGVRVVQGGAKKEISMDLVVPTRRSGVGSRRTTQVRLNGRQARQLFETLRSFYETRADVEQDTRVLWF